MKEDMRQFESTLRTFVESVLAQDAAIQDGDASMANLSGRKYIEAANELLNSDSGIDAFATLLLDSRISVSSAAATYLLPHRTREAILVLEAAAKLTGVTGLGAVMTLARWKRGEKGMWEEIAQIAKRSKLPKRGC